MGRPGIARSGAAIRQSPRLMKIQSCPVDLSGLRDEIEGLAPHPFQTPRLKRTVRASLNASIPEAIQQADGIDRQLGFFANERLSRKSNFVRMLKSSPARPVEMSSGVR